MTGCMGSSRGPWTFLAGPTRALDCYRLGCAEQPGRVGDLVASGADPDNDAPVYHWDFGDGTVGEGRTPSHVFRDSGTYNVSVVADDGFGGESSAAVTTVTITNAPPVVSLTFGIGSSQTLLGEATNFSLFATDPAPADRAAGFSISVDWGDLSPAQQIAASPGNGAGV